MTQTNDVFDAEGRLREQYVQDAFHSYLKSSLAQAKAEHLVDVQMLSSAEGDLMVTGPALCLYFAALRCTTNPPSVPLPRRDKRAPQLDLSEENCPAPFVRLLQLWALAVPDIQALPPDSQHDLARIICGLPSLARNPSPLLSGVAADLRAVATEISLRRSFQDRYATDLQAAIDTGAGPGLSAKASFVPPPEYTPSPPTSPPIHSGKDLLPPPPPPRPQPRIETAGRLSAHAQTAPLSATSTLLSPAAPAIELIRETLYAALGDVLARTPALRGTLRTDPPRAYFGAVALAILCVAETAIGPDGAVRGVLGTELTLSACPAPLRPLMMELAAIGRVAGEMEEQDTEEAMRRAAVGEDIPPPRLERVRAMLELGAGHDVADGRVSAEGRAVAFANRVNALALNMTRLPAFRERQADVFKVLAGVS